ncbi:hypothetical protein [Candidatus Chlorohelix sp.]|uniref:hypothetical protein n=1 Tax=Candidatus Chlorohelix sp. TaxID=3139201 RepID=UPI00306E2C10
MQTRQPEYNRLFAYPSKFVAGVIKVKPDPVIGVTPGQDWGYSYKEAVSLRDNASPILPTPHG